MKAWFRNYLDPLNLWGYSLAFNYWFLRVYQRWLWEPFLDKLLSNDSKVVADKSGYSRSHICVQCEKRVKLALVTKWDNRINFFCSIECKNKWGYFIALEEDFDSTQQPSI